MVPRVSKAGTSFKGAAAYYLHDKKAATAERVGWTETLNLSTDDPEQAWRQMAQTAKNADHLKQAAGIKATGRKSTKSVYVYSLSWHPEQHPTREDMSAAARDSLKALKLDDRQAIIIAHTDQQHPHVHVMVNRVSQTDGRMAANSKDFNALSRWADKYCKDRGWDYCPERTANNAKRKQGEFVKHDPDRYLWRRSKTEATIMQQATDRAALRAAQGRERTQLVDRIGRQRAEIRKTWKPVWRDLYQKQDRASRRIERQCRSFAGRLSIVVTRGADLGLTASDVFRPKRIKQAVTARQKADRAHLADLQGRDYTKRLKPLEAELTRIDRRNTSEDRTMDDQHRTELRAAWDEQKQGKDQADYDRSRAEARQLDVSMRDQIIAEYGIEAVERAEKKRAERETKEQERKADRDLDDGSRTMDR